MGKGFALRNDAYANDHSLPIAQSHQPTQYERQYVKIYTCLPITQSIITHLRSVTIPGYQTRKLKVSIGEHKFRLKALLDKQQYFDPDGAAERAGVSSATWPLFGQLWPAGKMLAKAVSSMDIQNRRILEVGCGLGLPSLVLHKRGADVTASDHHPLAERFLGYNAALNDLDPIKFVNLRWEEPRRDLGSFEVIIGSDVLYERDHAEMLAEQVNRYAAKHAKVLITCPQRGYRNRFSRMLKDQGFTLSKKPWKSAVDEQPSRGKLLKFTRVAA